MVLKAAYANSFEQKMEAIMVLDALDWYSIFLVWGKLYRLI